MKRLLTIALAALLLPATGQAKKGLYLGFNLGYASVSGDSPVIFPQSRISLDPDYAASDPRLLLSTDVASGFSAGFRIGYNVLGVVAIELMFTGSGNNLGDSNKTEGQGALGGVVRLFPVQFAPRLADRWWDPYVFVGGAVHFMGWYPQSRTDGNPMINDGRAWWPGYSVNYGLGADFYPIDFLSLGLDLMFANAAQDTFHIDDATATTATPTDDATAFIFTTTVKITFHFLTD